MHRLPLIIFILTLMLWSCGANDASERIEVDKDTVPTMITDSVNSFISDSGIVRYHLESPVWLMYDEADEPYWYFPQGLSLEQYDDNMKQAASMVSDTARYFSRLKLWKLDGNVRMRNVEGDKFLTQQMFWNQKEHKVYSDSFVHIERATRIIEGYGFISNEQITSYTIRRPTGIFPTEGFTGGNRKTSEPETLQQEE